MAKPDGRVLVVAGSDSGGGAGIQGDIKTITTLSCYAATAITALTAQNTQGVFGIHDVPDDFIKQQITLVVDDIGVDCFKTGMLHKASVIRTVAECLLRHIHTTPLVLDPVMFAKGGAPLLAADALDTLKEYLIPLAEIVTPNIPEAEFLSGTSIHSLDDMKAAADKILTLGCKSVLIKGGHMNGATVMDLLVTDSGTQEFHAERINTPHTHGTGCSMASAIATGLAQKIPLTDSVKRAHRYIQEAIKNAPGFGHGHGPLGHTHTVKLFTA